MVRVRLLGGVGATTDAGEPLDVGPPKCQTVLAALALSAGEAVTVSRLIDVVWGEQPPDTAPKILQGYVSRLRKSLGAAAITRAGAAYRLEPVAVEVDVTGFRERAASGDIQGALAAWTGTPLAGLDAPGLSPSVVGLVEQWLEVVERDLARRTDTDPASSVGPLAELTSAHPLREGLWVLLMTALYRSGRQADALAAYQRARGHLVEELGVEPGERLRDLQQRILAGTEPVTAAPPATDCRAPLTPTGDEASGPPPADTARTRPTGTVTFGYLQVAQADRLRVEHRRKMTLALARLDTVVREITNAHGGTLLTSTGEMIGAVFHRASDASAWAGELHLAADQEPWPGGIDIGLQVGLHTGEAEEDGGRYFGAAVHTARQLADAADARQTLTTGVTAAVLERDDLRSLGSHRLDGVAGVYDLYQLDGGQHPPPRTASTNKGNLPRPRTTLLGRDREVAATCDGLATAPVVTLVGPGGIGKTSLAVAVAHRWREDTGGRVWFVELDVIESSGDALRLVAETLGLVERGGDPTDAIVGSVAALPTLLVLDNCEHVVEGAARLAQAVRDGAPRTRVLATSRERLAIADEHLVAVAPLDPDGAAVELFDQRARAVAPDLDLASHRATVAEICRRLDGLPLAIELAAARTRSLTPEQLRDRLDDRLRLLAGGRAGNDRHQTLRATVAWSYHLLSPRQRWLFERLAVFMGPFDLAAVEAVATEAGFDAIDVDAAFGDLVDRSMVTTEHRPLERRFRLLETLRYVAAERLAANQDRVAVEKRHGAWCRDEIARIGRDLSGPAEVDAVTALDGLWPNLRAAVERAVGAGDRQLAADLVRPIVTECNLRRRADIGRWAEDILGITPLDDEGERVFWLSWALHRHMQAGDRPAFDRLVREHDHVDEPLVRFAHAYLYEDAAELCAASPGAVAWLRDRGHTHAAGLVELTGVGSGLMAAGRFDELDTQAAGWAERYRRQGPPTLRYFALGMLGYAAQLRGDGDAARRHFLEAAGIEVPAGTYAVSRPVEARAVFEAGDQRRAFAMLRDHIEELLGAGTVDVARLVAVEFITIMAALDRLDDAAPALAYLDTTGDFGALARSALVAEAARRIDAHTSAVGGPPDGTAVLHHMRDVLDALDGAPPGSSPPS